MNRAAHFNFALNIYKLALSDTHLSRNPGRFTKTGTGEIINHQTVNLPYTGAFNVH